MAIVDDRGRVFGRVNLVDAVLLLVLLGLIPLAYGAYALFRTPAPTLRAVEPAVLQHSDNMRVIVRGDNLRPYMRVSFNDKQGRNFLFASTGAAEVELGTVSPGTYDVVLYDYAQERARLPKALTILPPPLPVTTVIVVGMLANLPEGIARQIVKGVSLRGFGEVLEAGRPVPEATRVHVGDGVVDIPLENAFRVPIAFRMACSVQMVDGQPACGGAGIVLKPDAFVQLRMPMGNWPLQISEVRGPQPLQPVEAVVRFVGHPATLALVRAGDMDLGRWMNELAAGARVLRVAAPRAVPASIADDAAAEDITLLLQAQKGADGWRYSGEALRAGGAFVLRTPDYELHGSILRLTAK